MKFEIVKIEFIWVDLANMSRIHFNEENHTYQDLDSGLFLTPVSTVYSRYKNEFVVTGPMLINAGIKNNIHPRDVQDFWSLGTKYSQSKGTCIHLCLQCWIEYKILLDDDLKHWVFQFDELKISGDLSCEERVFSLEHLVCGTADLVVREFGVTDIYDFKSNKKLEKVAYGNKKMKDICSAFSDCNFSHYSIQLSLYAAMLELSGEFLVTPVMV